MKKNEIQKKDTRDYSCGFLFFIFVLRVVIGRGKDLALSTVNV